MRRDLLLEIGTEEIPSALVEIGRGQLAEATAAVLERERLAFSEIRAYSTPRRLAVVAVNVAEFQAARNVEVKGPAANVAFDKTGAPTKAAEGFAASQRVAVEDLEVREVNGGSYVFAVRGEPEEPAANILPAVCRELVLGLSFPKSMRWGSGTLRFARPIRWICCLFGEEVVSFDIEGLSSDAVTRGHRILAPEFFRLQSASEYENELRARKVLCDPVERREVVTAQIEQAAKKAGGSPYINPDVLTEVVNLVEWPSGVAGSFAPEFLAVPAAVVKTAMQSHQRYFPVEGSSGELMPAFVVVQNGNPKFEEQIRRGHERVLRARLADAAFFFMEDTRGRLSEKVEQLDGVVFQSKLGSMLAKTARLEALTGWLSGKLGLSASSRQKAKRAARLCKGDLVTSMVGEFPELQGTLGREYALIDGEDPEVAEAIFEHYLPRFSGDDLPKTETGSIVAVCDKADSLAGFFSIGLVPSGSQDPYSLRRQAHGLVSIVWGNRWDVSIAALIAKSLESYAAAGVEADAERKRALYDFIGQRLGKHLVALGYQGDVVESVQKAGYDTPASVMPRLEALMNMRASSTLEDAKIAFTRCENLADADIGDNVDPKMFVEESERNLHEALTATGESVERLVRSGEFEKAIAGLAGMRPAIDAFFDDVLVMEKDERLKRNRLALLNGCVAVARLVCNFSELHN